MKNSPSVNSRPCIPNPDSRFPDLPALLAKSCGSYATGLGIDLKHLHRNEIYKWFLAALLYGARIPENIATRTWHEFERNNMLTPQSIVNAGWNKLVAILDSGGYVRYDYKTATKLLNVNQTLLVDYGGDLNTLHATATDPKDLVRRIMALGKGIGVVTTCIFLRELRGKWEKSDPPLSSPALFAAQKLGYLPSVIGTNREALNHLQQLWLEHGMSAASFADFEAALVRKGLQMRRYSARHPDRDISTRLHRSSINK